MEMMQLIQLQSFTHGENDAADSTAYFTANLNYAVESTASLKMAENYAVESTASLHIFHYESLVLF